jgi:hypothetical protein
LQGPWLHHDGDLAAVVRVPFPVYVSGALEPLAQDLPWPKRAVARLTGFDGAYLRFAGALTVESYESGRWWTSSPTTRPGTSRTWDMPGRPDRSAMAVVIGILSAECAAPEAVRDDFTRTAEFPARRVAGLITVACRCGGRPAKRRHDDE